MTDADKEEISTVFAHLTMAFENAATSASEGQNPNLAGAEYAGLARAVIAQLGEVDDQLGRLRLLLHIP
ncbi:hypothetical protein [Shimia sediminis]|uniref:hypothetical protein n=1 Tax=Shimia sediminis TaxID=2497945 RepID=UPI000F8D1AE2|nr:hypothetical protein [Shimia sediminis]